MKRLLTSLILLLATASALAQGFRVEEIQVEGLQRISEGTVFSFVPIDIGDELTPARARSTIRDLFRTGFFADVALEQEGNTLIIRVQERPAIAAITISGNRQITTDDLLPALAQIGIAEGEVFNQLELDRVRQELIRQYFGRGHYGVDVDARITELERNRVNLAIVVEEGKPARIRHLNIVGNESFDQSEIRRGFESDSRRGLAFWRGRTRYTREKLSGDLERLRAFYLDRGYIDFAIESTQVSISPDKRDIFITANIFEGEVFRVSDVLLTGDLVLSEEILRQLIMVETGENFSRKDLEATVDSISRVLANIGYAFANVNPIPRIDRETRTVEINFFVDPGKRVYVRRIEFQGNTQTKDEVLRREMRQFEGAWFSQAAIDRSRLRLQRLGFFENINIETPAVEGTDDQIDIIVSVDETPSGSFQVGLGYSQVQGLIASVTVQQDNFLGSGRQVGFSVSRSRILSQVSLNYNNPYWTDDGVSRGFFLRYSDFNQGRANISAFSTSVAAAGMSIGFPASEIDFFRFGASVQRLDINAGRAGLFPSDPEDPDSPPIFRIEATRPLAISLDADGDGFLSRSERRVNTYRLDAAWSRDTRNHFLNPTRGSLNRISLDVAVPGSTREFYKVNYRFRKFFPIGERSAFGLRGDLAYGDSYDNYDSRLQAEEIEPEILAGNCQLDEVVTLDRGLPFYEHFFAGGVRDIRGFEDNTLGPKDQFCLAVGGDFKVSGGVEYGFPLPFVEGTSTRLAWFVDVGNVYRDFDDFDASLLRASTGLSLTWQAPVGPIIINVAQPIRQRDGDDTQLIQFSFGGQF